MSSAARRVMRFLLAMVQSGLLCVAGALVLLFGFAGVVVAAGTSDGPASLLLWAGVAVATIAGVSLLTRGMALVGDAERSIARAEVVADAERIEELDRTLADLLEPIVAEHLDSLVVTRDAMGRGTGRGALEWARAVDRFYEGVVVPRTIDDLPEERFRALLAACGGSTGPERASVTDRAFKERAIAWIEGRVGRGSSPAGV